MNTPETINIEKYAEALNNLIGVDSAYFQGDKDVNAVVELIVAAKKLEKRVKELEEEKDALIKNYAQCMKDYARDIFDELESMTEVHEYHDVEFGNWTEQTVELSIEDIVDLRKKYVEGKV